MAQSQVQMATLENEAAELEKSGDRWFSWVAGFPCWWFTVHMVEHGMHEHFLIAGLLPACWSVKRPAGNIRLEGFRDFINALVKIHGMLERDIHIESQKSRWNLGHQGKTRSICMINLLSCPKEVVLQSLWVFSVTPYKLWMFHDHKWS